MNRFARTAVLVAAAAAAVSCSPQAPQTTQTSADQGNAVTPVPPPSHPVSTAAPVSERAATPEASISQNPDHVQILQRAVDTAVAEFGGIAGLAVSDGARAMAAGDDTAYPAWSTSKVPIAVAALRNDPAMAGPAAAAIVSSNNEAAETLWLSLPDGAADEVFTEAGVPVIMNTEKIRPEFSVFGQTAWSPSSQATFAANLPCVPGAAPVLELMGQVSPDQAYGIGQLPGARFKGGWGPDKAGNYQVRQFGRFIGAEGEVAVALTAIPASGQYGDAQAMASMMATQIAGASLPVAVCD